MSTTVDGGRARTALLGGVLALGEVESVESFCREVLSERLRQSGAYLNAIEYEDALSYLIADAWVLWERFDPAKGTRSFSTYAYRILRRRVASWYRQRFVDARYRTKPVWVSLDDEDLELLAAEWEWIDEPKDLYAQINVAALSPEGRLIFEKLARPMVERDLSLGQLAQEFGYTRRWVSRELERLREEVEPMLDGALRRN